MYQVQQIETAPYNSTVSTKPKKSLADRIADADARGSNWLALANEAAERGDHVKAEKLYTKGQYWLDLSNNLRGCGPE